MTPNGWTVRAQRTRAVWTACEPLEIAMITSITLFIFEQKSRVDSDYCTILPQPRRTLQDCSRKKNRSTFGALEAR